MPITTDSRHVHAIAPNLLEQKFDAALPDTVWLADISYIPTDEGCLYLAAVKDLAKIEIVGWSMSERLKSPLCKDALNMAIRIRRPPRGLIHHSDRGAQYASGNDRKLLRLHDIKVSMRRKVIASTMPLWRAFSVLSKPSSCTEPGSSRDERPEQRSSKAPKSSTIAKGATQASATGHQFKQGWTSPQKRQHRSTSPWSSFREQRH